MYAAAGGASLAGRKARQHGRQPAPPSPRPHSPLHPAPTGVRAYSCQHWEARLAPPARPLSAPAEHHSPCDGNECAAGRAAWQEAAAVSIGGGGAGAGGAARRCSVLGDHPGARRDPRAKWHRNNRVRDASYGSSSESDGEPDGTSGEPWGVARLLYAGLGTLALGLVVYFVGTGDKGFKTPALRLVGPSLIVAGLACCFVRILFCIFAKPCCRRRPSYKETRRMSVCGEGEEMPLAGCGRGAARGPAQCSPARRLDSSCDVSSLSSGEEDERLRRYRTHSIRTTQIASQGTSLHSPLQQSASNQSALQPTVSPQSLVQSASAHSAIQQSASPQNALHPSASTQNAFQQSASPQNASQHSASPQNALQQSASPQNALQQSASTRNVLQQSASTQNTLHQSALTQPAGAGPPARRPPPRTVSFAGGPDGELVLSPAQLRS